MSEARSEDDWIASAARTLRAAAGPEVAVGVGDDAAAVRIGGGLVLAATDVLVDGVHFELAECGPRAAARKALAVNLSDLAAMAGAPICCLVGGVLPRPPDRALFEALMAGVADAAARYACPCVGGDTNVGSGPLVLAVTVLGAPGPGGVIERRGARVGQHLSVTGALGGSRAGRHLTFEPRLREAQQLAALGIPSAMIDLSDGLSRDLPRLCAASGVGATLVGDAIPVHADVAALAGRSARSALAHALHDGEDFELLLAHDPLTDDAAARLAADGVRLTRIGRIESSPGVRLEAAGEIRPLVAAGFDHVDPGTD